MKTSQYEIALMASQCVHHNFSSACTCTRTLRAFLEHSVSHESLLPFSWMRGNLTDHIKKKKKKHSRGHTKSRYTGTRETGGLTRILSRIENLQTIWLKILSRCYYDVVYYGHTGRLRYECHSKGVIHDYIKIARWSRWCYFSCRHVMLYMISLIPLSWNDMWSDNATNYTRRFLVCTGD